MALVASRKIVSIGIQARSGSVRLPEKSLRLLGKRPVVEHVFRSARAAATRLNARMEGYGIVVCDVSVLTPPGDPIISKLKLPTLSAPGGEEDVLLRYHHLANHTGADYIVRVTGDCPLLPPSVIVRHVNIATTNEYDYLSNVDERCRTAPDGYDCEVISRRLLTWLHESAKDASDREHVTTLARRAPPAWAKRGAIVSSLDLSAMKLSIDTEADFQSVENEAGKVDRALETAATLFGANVHRI